MRLRLACWPLPHECVDALAPIEQAVIRRLLPPLNLKEVVTPWRSQIGLPLGGSWLLRRAIGQPSSDASQRGVPRLLPQELLTRSVCWTARFPISLQTSSRESCGTMASDRRIRICSGRARLAGAWGTGLNCLRPRCNEATVCAVGTARNSRATLHRSLCALIRRASTNAGESEPVHHAAYRWRQKLCSPRCKPRRGRVLCIICGVSSARAATDRCMCLSQFGELNL